MAVLEGEVLNLLENLKGVHPGQRTYELGLFDFPDAIGLFMLVLSIRALPL